MLYLSYRMDVFVCRQEMRLIQELYMRILHWLVLEMLAFASLDSTLPTSAGSNERISISTGSSDGTGSVSKSSMDEALVQSPARRMMRVIPHSSGQ